MPYTLRGLLMALALLALIGRADVSPAGAAESHTQLQEAFAQAMQSLQTATGEEALRLQREVIALVGKMDSPPPLPLEAQRHAAKGLALARQAAAPADFAAAADEYAAALRPAPWHGEYWYNAGILLESAGRLKEAVQSLELYTLAAPGAADIPDVLARMAEIEVRLEKKARSSGLADFVNRTWHFVNMVKSNGVPQGGSNTYWTLTVNLSPSGDAVVTVYILGTSYIFEGREENGVIEATYKGPKHDLGDTGHVTLSRASSFLSATMSFSYMGTTFTYDDYLRR